MSQLGNSIFQNKYLEVTVRSGNDLGGLMLLGELTLKKQCYVSFHVKYKHIVKNCVSMSYTL